MTSETVTRHANTPAAAGSAAGGDGGAQGRYTNDFTQLAQQVRESGLLRRRYGYYWVKMALTAAALGGVVAGIVLLGDSWLQLLMAGALAVVFTQFAFLGHDAAHRQIMASGRANDWTGMIVGILGAGLSMGWWQTKHTKHHANPNKHLKDPDIESGAVAFTPYTRAEWRGLRGFLADRQGWFFLPLLLLEGINLHVNSVQRILSRKPMKRRGWEIAFLAIRHGGYVAALLLVMSPVKVLAFLGIQLGLYGFYLGGAFTPNHTGMPTVPPDMTIDFLRRQVLMSRNVRGGWFIHFLMGGLNYQIEHHLFPSMPRPNLRRVQPIVREFCAMHGIAYTENGLLESYRIVLRYLNNVGLAARDPFGCPLAAQLRAPA